MKFKETLKSSWKYFKPNETILIFVGVFLFMTILTVMAMYRKENKFDSNVRYENLTAEQRRQVESFNDEAKLGEDDSMVRQTERVREASSIGLGLSLFLVRERVSNNRTLNLKEVMTEFAKSEILPPGCQVLQPDKTVDYGVVRTQRGIYYVRYLSQPLKIEILSSGVNGLADGNTFILRLPDTSAAKIPVEANSPKVTTAGAWATLFEAPPNVNHYIPAPFAPAQSFQAMNWKIVGLQQVEFSPEKLQEINNFLQKQN